jgi:tetratricopeptide (TPR) repeat protein
MRAVAVLVASLLGAGSPAAHAQAARAATAPDAERRAAESLAIGDLPAAAALYLLAADLHSQAVERARLLVAGAWLLHLLERPEEARAALGRALAELPDLTLQQELYNQAFIDLYHDAFKRSLEERAQRANQSIREALLRLDAGDLEGARSRLGEALALRPNHAAALYNLALVDLRAGRQEEALAGFEKVLALARADPASVGAELQGQALNNLGLLYHERGFPEDAEAALSRAVELDPRHARAWNNLGLARRRLGKKEAATAAFRRAYELDPADDAVLNNLALAYLDAGSLRDAAQLLAEGTRRSPQSASLWLNRGIAQRGLSDPAAADSFTRVLALDPDNRGALAERAAAFLALLHYEQGRHDLAAGEARRTLAWRPEDVESWTYLGLAQQASGDLDGARQSLERAAQLDPTRWELYNNLGSVYFRLGEYVRARETFERALGLRPDSLAAEENLGQTRKKLAELEAVRARLGVAVATTRAQAPAAGLLLTEVVASSPAGRAALEPGDHVLRVEGAPVDSASDLYFFLNAQPPPKALTFELVRAGKPQRVKVKLQ